MCRTLTWKQLSRESNSSSYQPEIKFLESNINNWKLICCNHYIIFTGSSSWLPFNIHVIHVFAAAVVYANLFETNFCYSRIISCFQFDIKLTITCTIFTSGTFVIQNLWYIISFFSIGYCFLLFQDEMSVQALVESCIIDDEKLYWCVSSPTMKDKPVCKIT